ncbi:Retrovirus-related Pol polyprotein from transposon RE2 [Vitis vinifera]|uniref:Retrovirus-related Pol polyprotein from transposon RE2 n=1 Tax=Vitis vinifera TaxID=29760 RepID=A0A438HV69_VITVI|nr:Retrovirus-related Pol polyprotein from transposon RE2 [Vitis vinifera]
MVTRSKSGVHKPKLFTIAINSTASHVLFEPITYKQVVSSLERFKAMENEFQALLKNNTWTLVSPTQKVIGSKWVYHLKLLPDGSVAKHKARLMAKGFLETLALDYFHTVNLVVKPTTIRVVLCLTLSRH